MTKNPDYYNWINENFIPLKVIRDEKDFDRLFKLYKGLTTPTVLVLNADAEEIDRVVGYSAPADEFLEKMKIAYRGENTIALLKKAAEDNPDDLMSKFKLAYKYQTTLVDRNGAKTIFNEIIEDPRSKDITLPYKLIHEDDIVNLYEYCLYLNSHFERYVEEFPDSRFTKDSYDFLASMYSYNKPPVEAAEFFADMLEKYPDDDNFKFYHVLFATNKKADVENAVKSAETLYDSYKLHDSYMMRQYASLLSMNDDKDRLDEVFGQKFMKSQLDNVKRMMYYYGLFWAERGENTEDALAMAKLLAKMDPEYKRSAAAIFLKAGDFDTAFKHYGSKYLEKNLNNANNLYSYAYFWASNEKNLETALYAINTAIDLKPDYGYFYDTRGTVLWKIGKYDEAISSIEKAKELIGRPMPRYDQRIEEIKKERDGKIGKK